MATDRVMDKDMYMYTVHVYTMHLYTVEYYCIYVTQCTYIHIHMYICTVGYYSAIEKVK